MSINEFNNVGTQTNQNNSNEVTCTKGNFSVNEGFCVNEVNETGNCPEDTGYSVKFRTGESGSIEVPNIAPGDLALDNMDLDINMNPDAEGKYTVLQHARDAFPGAAEYAQNLGTQAHVMGTQAQVLGTQAHVMGTQAQVLGTQAQVLGTQAHVMGTQAQVLGMGTGIRYALDILAVDASGKAVTPEGNVCLMARLDLGDHLANALNSLADIADFTVDGKFKVPGVSLEGLDLNNPDLTMYFHFTMVKDASITGPVKDKPLLSMARYVPTAAPAGEEQVMFSAAIKVKDLKEKGLKFGDALNVYLSTSVRVVYVTPAEAKKAGREPGFAASYIEATGDGITIHLDIEIRMVKDASITAPQSGEMRLFVTHITMKSKIINGEVHSVMVVTIEMVKDASITLPLTGFYLDRLATMEHTCPIPEHSAEITFITLHPARTTSGGAPATRGGNAGFAGQSQTEGIHEEPLHDPATRGGGSGFAGQSQTEGIRVEPLHDPATRGGNAGFAGQSQTEGIHEEPLHYEEKQEFVERDHATPDGNSSGTLDECGPGMYSADMRQRIVGTAKKSYGKVRDGIMHVGGSEYPLTNSDPDKPADATYSKKPKDVGSGNNGNDEKVQGLLKTVWNKMKDVFDDIFGIKRN
ncbi:MAG: hypothetical protein GY765_05330 [bacterium]|nr:hypothetical protein [bacterium]